MLIEKEQTKIYHIHVPRTGGRYISNLFDNNGYKVYFEHSRNFYKNSIIEELLTYPYYETLYNFEDIPTFIVIRDPIDRFVSVASYDFFARKVKQKTITDIFKTKESLLHYIKEQQTTHCYHNNFFTPQYKFIGPKTKMWKFEKGLSYKFIDWINEQFNLNIVWKLTHYKHKNKLDVDFYDDYEKVKISKDNIKVLEDFYRKDLEIWSSLQ